MNPAIQEEYDRHFARYVLAGASIEQHEAVLRMLRWMREAETREEFILYMDGLDTIGVFSIKFMKLLVKLHPADKLLMKAIKLKVIRKKI